MGFPDLFEFVLDFPNGEVLGVLDFLERVSDLVEFGRVNSCSSQDLVNLGVFGLVSLQDCLHFLFQNQIPESGLAVQLVDQSVELIVQVLLLPLQVLHLLQLNFVLPLKVANAAFNRFNLLLAVF